MPLHLPAPSFKTRLLFSACCLFSLNLLAEPAELKPIGPGLTPYGAEQAASQDKMIPEWQGGLTPDNMPAVKQGLENPFKNEKPLYVITSKNADQYPSLLTPGQLALLKTYPDTYRLPVYPTHRTAAAPSWVYRNIASNHANATLVNDGNGIQQSQGGVAFPVPKQADGEYDAQKIIWNHITRWAGMYVTMRFSESAVQRNGSYVLTTSEMQYYSLYNNPELTANNLNNRLFYLLGQIREPARLSGDAILIHETLDRTLQERQSWVYNTGTKRVIRTPSVAYDTPAPASDNLVTMDDTDMFNGALDRYDWHFLGKQIKLIPYNHFDLSNTTHDDKQVLKTGHINPELTRYEAHRVWVVEATLKKGTRHIYHKRRFYLDEDTWSIVESDKYDARGDLWRVSLNYLVNYYHVPATLPALIAHHDLQAQRYFAGFLDNSKGIAVQFHDTAPQESHFTPQNLRRLGR